MEKKRRNVILADCDSCELETFREGLEAATGKKFHIESFISNRGHGSLLKQLVRYVKYFIVPLRIFLHRDEYDMIVGWQQFYANIFAFYCRLFQIKKRNILVSCNFTYKRKGSIIGGIYYRFMKYALANQYIDYLHVLSHAYAKRCAEELGIPNDKFLITTFGIPDIWEKYKSSSAPERDYVLSIGRSNRDFDFLLSVWAEEELKGKKLILISDTYRPNVTIPQNVKIYHNIVGEASLPWMVHCEMMILPIDDGNIASGDTVLLRGMQFEKTVVITKPSTLAEMYVNDGIDGIAIEKNVKTFARKVSNLLADKQRLETIGKEARLSYLNKFSRRSLGVHIGEEIRKAYEP